MPSSLRDYDFQISYGPGDDGLHRFYIPALERSLHYDRSAGFFSSSALAVAAAGVARLIQNGGRMRLLVGAQLSNEDVAAIQAGHDLAGRVSQRLLEVLANLKDALLLQRLQVLAWMVADETLEIRVVLPAGPDGHPLPGDQAIDYYHPKEGVFTDSSGDQIAFSGSVNESETAWVHNYEQFMVYRSWDVSRPFLTQVVRRFQRLWEGDEKDWIAIPIPQAVRERLISFCPEQTPKIDPLELKEPADGHKKVRDGTAQYVVVSKVPDATSDEQRDRVVAQFLKDAPFLPNAKRLGAATSAVVPWPHQHRVADAIIERFPDRFLIADEVGLGKTIEAGLVIRQLLLSGRVKRCLILAPKSVLRQWQEELYEKFALEVPIFDGSTFWTVFGTACPPSTDNPFDSKSVLLASSQLVKRRDRQGQLLEAGRWDLVVVDEAHHARRKDFLTDRYRPNRLMELLNDLKEKTRGLILLTATPMQVHPVEVWDLLRVLGMGGRWGADQEFFLRFFGELRKDFGDVDWDFVYGMVQDYLSTGGTEDPQFAATAQKKLGLVTWQQVRALPESTSRGQVIKQLPAEARSVVLEYARRHTPIRRFVFRNTRTLLKEYRRLGILQANVPEREPHLEWIPMTPTEKGLYDRIEKYITDFYAKYEAERKGLGFIMTVYRRRLTSSFYAIERSLEKRLAYLRGLAPSLGLGEDDLEQDELDEDISEVVSDQDRKLFLGEMAYVEDFLSELRVLTSDSKLEWLLRQLGELFLKRETVVIFTQYADTMDYLREQLRQVYGSQVACYSGRGGEVWRQGAWLKTTKEEIKTAFRKGDEIKILLGTDALSEGLNLQTCGMMINFDMPWNPMRVEQRIGRIDRIGQTYRDVWIHNYFYEDTIEAKVYERLSDRIDWFSTVVGELQPILSRVARSIQTLAMTPVEERQHRMEEELAQLRTALEQQTAEGLALDEPLDRVPSETGGEVPVTLADLERLLTTSPSLAQRFTPHPQIPQAYLLSSGDGLVAVTFAPEVFDSHPNTVRLLTYGEPLLQELLAHVEPPVASKNAEGLLRCSADQAVSLRCYYRPTEREPVAVHTIGELEQLVEKGGPLAWPEEEQTTAEAEFREQVESVTAKDEAVVLERQRAEMLALEERGRQLLLRAALVELALGQRPSMFDQPLPSAFSEQAVVGLKRHKYPFAPLLTLVGVTGLMPSPADPFYVSIQNESDEALRRRFDQLKGRAAELVKQLAPGVGEVDGATDNSVAVKGEVLTVPHR